MKEIEEIYNEFELRKLQKQISVENLNELCGFPKDSKRVVLVGMFLIRFGQFIIMSLFYPL